MAYAILTCETHIHTLTPTPSHPPTLPHTDNRVTKHPKPANSHDTISFFWLQTVGGAGITTQWYSRRSVLYINAMCQQMFLMTERLFQLRLKKKKGSKKNEECKWSNAVISKISTVSKENTEERCALIPFNPDHSSMACSYLTLFRSSKIKEPEAKKTSLFLISTSNMTHHGAM